jgi:nucleotide-binding universal stress UspA family protein
VAEEILRRASCPVLTVGPHAGNWDDLPLDRSEILYATDFSPEAYAAALQAFAWAGELAARLTLFHVVEDGTVLNFSRPEEPTDAAIHLLKRLLPKDAESRFTYQLLVEQGGAAEKIVATAERLRAALIVIGARTAVGFPGAATHLSTSVVHQVIAQAPCAVLSAR